MLVCFLGHAVQVTYVIAPFLDLLNHSSDAATEVRNMHPGLLYACSLHASLIHAIQTAFLVWYRCSPCWPSLQLVACSRTIAVWHSGYCVHVCYGAQVTYDWLREAYRVTAGKQYSTGQEVYVSYGELSNDALLELYGFVEANNTNDRYGGGSTIGALDATKETVRQVD